MLLQGQSSWLLISYAMEVYSGNLWKPYWGGLTSLSNQEDETGPSTLASDIHSDGSLSPPFTATSQTNIEKCFQSKWHLFFLTKNQDTAPPYLYLCQCQLPLFKNAAVPIVCLDLWSKVLRIKRTQWGEGMDRRWEKKNNSNKGNECNFGATGAATAATTCASKIRRLIEF